MIRKIVDGGSSTGTYILLVIVSYFKRIEHDKHHKIQSEEVQNVTLKNCLFASELL